MITTSPYGSWASPLSAAALSAQSLRLAEPQLLHGRRFWLETRPEEQGRCVLVMGEGHGAIRDLLPAPHSLRTRAQEYGGGAYALGGNEVFCVLDGDQRIYRLSFDGNLTPLTPAGPWRYGDLWLDRHHRRLLCVREDHSRPDAEPITQLVALTLDATSEQGPCILATGADFYSNPRVSPDGRQLSWLQWNHPQMPWDGTQLWLADLDERGQPQERRQIAGSESESLFQPQWSPGGQLLVVSDRSNWWNLYRWSGSELEALLPMEAEFATPQWVFGMSCYDFLDAERLLCCYTQQGRWHMGCLNLAEGNFTPLESPLWDISAICCEQGQALLLGAGVDSSPALYRYTNNGLECLRESGNNPLSAQGLSLPQAISFATRDGETAQGFYYPPHNPLFRAPEGEKPPAILLGHGGPTGATSAALNLKIQYWTSRGFAVLDVNYRGSTGYGRTYRDRLKGAWGQVDVIDLCSGADWLVDQGLADPKRLAVRGSSAGGYTVLAALSFSDRFTAGASLYGIGDLETLALDTHKFEARYLDTLVGPYPAARDTYLARSPLHHAEHIQCPVIFFQGLKDKVVPPAQAESMVAALDARGIPHAYVTFAEEGHGFRRADTLVASLEAELAFYAQVFGFTPADTLAPLNLIHGDKLTP
jgi:dipeptidyl aminopeptidase/acylaminoacyl peptidase